MTDNSIDVSIIITCYNEKDILMAGNVEELCKSFEQSKYSYEIVFVDDGSTDGSIELLKQLAEDNTKMKLILHEKNKGRGRSVEDGIKNASGRIVGFNDIDLSTPAYYMPVLCSFIDSGYDIATANRIYKIEMNVIHRTFHRILLSKGYKVLVRWFLHTDLIDTVTGCKFFNKNSILKVLDDMEDNHWFWDTEIMIRGYYSGLKIIEVPTVFIRKPEFGTTVKIFKDVWDYLKNLYKFRKTVDRLKRI